jgi:hypothetical protein
MMKNNSLAVNFADTKPLISSEAAVSRDNLITACISWADDDGRKQSAFSYALTKCIHLYVVFNFVRMILERV